MEAHRLHSLLPAHLSISSTYEGVTKIRSRSWLCPLQGGGHNEQGGLRKGETWYDQSHWLSILWTSPTRLSVAEVCRLAPENEVGLCFETKTRSPSAPLPSLTKMRPKRLSKMLVLRCKEFDTASRLFAAVRVLVVLVGELLEEMPVLELLLVVLLVPKPVPELVLELVLEVVVELVLKLVLEAVLELVPELVLDFVVELVPELVLECVLEVVVELVPELVLELVLEAVVELVPELVLELVLEAVVELVPELVLELVLEVVVDACAGACARTCAGARARVRRTCAGTCAGCAQTAAGRPCAAPASCSCGAA